MSVRTRAATGELLPERGGASCLFPASRRRAPIGGSQFASELGSRLVRWGPDSALCERALNAKRLDSTGAASDPRGETMRGAAVDAAERHYCERGSVGERAPSHSTERTSAGVACSGEGGG